MEYTKPPENIIKQIRPILKPNGLIPAVETLSEENKEILGSWAREYAGIPVNNLFGDTSYKPSSFDDTYMELALQIMALSTLFPSSSEYGHIVTYLEAGKMLRLPNWPSTIEELVASFGKPKIGENANKHYENKVGSKPSGCMVIFSLIIMAIYLVIMY